VRRAAAVWLGLLACSHRCGVVQVYREVRQALVDTQAMFDLTTVHPSVKVSWRSVVAVLRPVPCRRLCVSLHSLLCETRVCHCIWCGALRDVAAFAVLL
jgi:hypothetical protein